MFSARRTALLPNPMNREHPVHTGSGPIALGDGSLRRSKLVVLVDELGRVVGVIVIEGVHADVERLRVLLQLLQLLDDRRPHRLRDNRTHRLRHLCAPAGSRQRSACLPIPTIAS